MVHRSGCDHDRAPVYTRTGNVFGMYKRTATETNPNQSRNRDGIGPGLASGQEPECAFTIAFLPPETLQNLRKMKVSGLCGAACLTRNLARTGSRKGIANVCVTQPEPEMVLRPDRSQDWKRIGTGVGTRTVSEIGSRRRSRPGLASGLQPRRGSGPPCAKAILRNNGPE